MSPGSAPEFSGYLVGWLAEHDSRPELYGFGTGDAVERLDTLDLDAPPKSGPNGAVPAGAGTVPAALSPRAGTRVVSRLKGDTAAPD